ncbi:monovalent cation:proton antiporter family protein [Salinibacter sp. 10B]|uniref:monovalent cation:proton antiporter family protein n=1 Tax=Salinibacter sp. 10B TaxID=1923971 RepID=UPI0021581730|nr:monovalent cation:proton antiporter family protein [Salinibacter sp. 10B]
MSVPVLAASLPFLGEIVGLFALSALIAYVCTRIRLVPIAGFLLTGVAVGPNALGLIQDPELVSTLAEIGVILLLFEIGIEFSLSKLSRLKRAISIGGGLQVGGIILVVTLGGWMAGIGWASSIYTGFLVALSSTAVVLSLLADRGETDTPSGQLSLAMLIFQDLAIVAMILIIPMLAGTGGSGWAVALALGKAALVIVVTLILARIIVPYLLKGVAHVRRPELFVLAVAAIGLGTAWLVSLAGVSLELGAFLAGLVVSESEYSEQALSEVLPFRSLFNAVFFVSVGMLLDLSFFLEEPFLLLGAVGGVLVIKFLITTVSALALGVPIRISAAVGLTLAQIGEFSFVLERTGRAVGLSPMGLGEAGEQTFIATAVLLMLATPALLKVGPSLGEWLQGTVLGRLSEDTDATPSAGTTELEDHVVIVGFGPAGRRLAQVLHEDDLPFVVVDLNPRSVQEAREMGYHAIYGDATRGPLLEEAGIQRAKLCVIVVNDQDAAYRMTHVARHENPTLRLIVRTRFLSELERFRDAGADVVVPEEIETSVQIFAHVLKSYQVDPAEIETQVRTIRAHDYELLRGETDDTAHLLLQGLDEEGVHTRTVRLRDACPAVSCTLGELALEETYGLRVLAVRRDGETRSTPDDDFALQADDRLVVLGEAEAFAESADLFRLPEPRRQGGAPVQQS